jgi:hypothetical protein
VIEDIIKNVMMMIDDDDQRMMRQRIVLFSERKCYHALRFSSSIFLSSSSLYVYRDHLFLSISLKLLTICSRAVYYENSCILENALSLTINRSSSVSLSRDRRRSRRSSELR